MLIFALTTLAPSWGTQAITGIRPDEMTLLSARFCKGGLALSSLYLISPIAYFSSLIASRYGIVKNNPHFCVNLLSPNPSPSAHIALDAPQHVLSTFSQRDDIASDIAELLKDVFPYDPATTSRFTPDLKKNKPTRNIQTATAANSWHRKTFLRPNPPWWNGSRPHPSTLYWNVGILLGYTPAT
jgi:hypothetical protein